MSFARRKQPAQSGAKASRFTSPLAIFLRSLRLFGVGGLVGPAGLTGRFGGSLKGGAALSLLKANLRASAMFCAPWPMGLSPIGDGVDTDIFRRSWRRRTTTEFRSGPSEPWPAAYSREGISNPTSRPVQSPGSRLECRPITAAFPSLPPAARASANAPAPDAGWLACALTARTAFASFRPPRGASLAPSGSARRMVKAMRLRGTRRSGLSP